MAGLFGFNQSPSPIARRAPLEAEMMQPQGEGFFGGMPSNDKWGIILSGLADAAGAFSGQEPKYLEKAATATQKNRLRDVMRKALKQDGSVDFNLLRSAIMQNSDDPSDILSAAKIGQDQYSVEGNAMWRKPYGGGMPEMVRELPQKGTVPTIVSTAQYLFPDNPQKQQDYILKNSPAAVKSIFKPPAGGGYGGGVPGLGADWEVIP